MKTALELWDVLKQTDEDIITVPRGEEVINESI